MSAGFAKKEEDKSHPVIRIFAPDVAANPAQHAAMKTLADNISHLKALLTEHGIAEADFVPPLARGTFVPDSDTHYEMRSHSNTGFMTNAMMNVQEAIYERTGLWGGLCEPLTPVDRELLQKQHKLSVIGSANIPDTRGKNA